MIPNLERIDENLCCETCETVDREFRRSERSTIGTFVAGTIFDHEH